MKHYYIGLIIGSAITFSICAYVMRIRTQQAFWDGVQYGSIIQRTCTFTNQSFGYTYKCYDPDQKHKADELKRKYFSDDDKDSK